MSERLNLLYVDDSETWRTYISDLFAQSGVETTVVPGSHQYRHELNERINTLDIILLDVNLPRESGLILAQDTIARYEKEKITLPLMYLISENKKETLEALRGAQDLFGRVDFIYKGDIGPDKIENVYPQRDAIIAKATKRRERIESARRLEESTQRLLDAQNDLKKTG